MLNFDLLKNPLNWLIVLFMLLIAGFVVDILVVHMSGKKASGGAVAHQDS